jgi:RNA polymerase sigma-70 factor (ECF subfamily)
MFSNDSDPNWEEVFRDILKGDRDSTALFLFKAQQPLFTFCLHLTRNKQLAEDLTHDTLLKALTNLAQLEKPNSYAAWLKSIARSKYLDILKSPSHLQNQVPLDDVSLREFQTLNFTERENSIAAREVLQMMSEEDRTLLILIDVQETSYAEAAQVLEIPEGTVKSRLSRARAKFTLLFNGTKSQSKSSTS